MKDRRLYKGCKQAVLDTEVLISSHFVFLPRKSRDAVGTTALSCIILSTAISRVYLLPRQPEARGPRLSLLSSWAGQMNHMSVLIL